MNITAMIYTLGMSISMVCRTRINILIGMDLSQTAKNYFKFTYISGFITGLLLALIVAPLAPFIADLVANQNEEMRSTFIILLTIYCFDMPFETNLYTGFVGIKTIGEIMKLVKVTIIALPIF